MYFGHIGVALAAKPIAPKVNLGVTLAAATALDTIGGVFSVAGVEYINADGSSCFPWSHGLFMSAVWSIAFLAIAFAMTRKARTGFVIGALVFSHWVLDFISHPMGMGETLPPDLPLLFQDSAKVGLGLYNSAVAAFTIEFALLGLGLFCYLKATRATDKMGKWIPALLPAVALMGALPATLLPPELSYITTFVAVPVALTGFWIDRHRRPVSEVPALRDVTAAS